MAQVCADDISVICSSGVRLVHRPLPFTVDRDNVHDLTATITSMAPGGIVAGSPTLSYRVNGGTFIDAPLTPTGNPDEYAATIPAQPWGTVVEYYLAAENDQGDTGTSPRDAPAACHYFAVDDEFSDALEWDTAWTVGTDDDDAATGIWTRADPVGTVYNSAVVQPEDDHTPDPGVACFVTGNGEIGGAAGANDVDHGRITLLSPVFDLSGGSDISLGYWRWYTNDRGFNPGEDFWRVDLSFDGGTSWFQVENTNISSNAWQEFVFDLPPGLPDPLLVQLRFIAEDIGGGSLVEAAVDDLVITGTFGGTTGVAIGTGSVPARFALDQNRPNPFNPITTIRFRIEQAGPVELAVYDTHGRLVDLLVDGWLPVGEHQVRWNGGDARGRAVASGVYFYVLESGEAHTTRRMTVAR